MAQAKSKKRRNQPSVLQLVRDLLKDNPEMSPKEAYTVLSRKYPSRVSAKNRASVLVAVSQHRRKLREQGVLADRARPRAANRCGGVSPRRPQRRQQVSSQAVLFPATISACGKPATSRGQSVRNVSRSCEEIGLSEQKIREVGWQKLQAAHQFVTLAGGPSEAQLLLIALEQLQFLPADSLPRSEPAAEEK